MTDPGTITIKTWSASFYDNEKRKWKYGELKCTPEFVEFSEDSTDEIKHYVKTIDHCDVKEIRKSLTGLIFRTIVITLTDKTKYWIASLSDQSSVFNVLQYFQHQHLLTEKKMQKDNKILTARSTEMGKKLLHSVHDSQDTLNNAANLLHEQGFQFESAMATMSDIHNDLDIADSILTGLESWLGKWNIPQQYKKESLEIIQSKDLPAELDYEILYTRMEMGKMNYQHIGILRVCTEGIIILTDKQKIVHNFKWWDISAVKVLSLCEITVTRYMIGQPDLTFDIVCTKLLSVIRLLDGRLKSKVEYIEDIFREEKLKKKPKPVFGSSVKESLLSKGKEEEMSDGNEDIPIQGSSDSTQLTSQVQGQKQIVSDQEVQEISQTLQNIKSVALATQQELDIQMNNIDKLTSTVDRANQRLTENEKRIKNLT